MFRRSFAHHAWSPSLPSLALLALLAACTQDRGDTPSTTSTAGAPGAGAAPPSGSASDTGDQSGGATDSEQGGSTATTGSGGDESTGGGGAEPAETGSPTSSSASVEDVPQAGTGGTAPASGGGSGQEPDPSEAGGAPAVGGAGEEMAAGGQGQPPVNAEPAVHFVGRFAAVDNGAQACEWSGSGVVARFEGESVSVTLQDSGENEFTVLIDGEEQPKLDLLAGSNPYPLASGLPLGEHTVELYRRTEAHLGTTVFEGFDFANGELLPPPTPKAHRLEIIGDSISCGYGNEGTSASCGFSPDTENHYQTYGAMAARDLDAEVVTIAWSGKGIIYNYGDDKNQPLPELYDRITPAGSEGAWNFSTQPEAVVINLGTNDFSTDDDPSAELFQSSYTEFLQHLREVYPEAFILCTVGPLLGGADLDAARSGISAAVAARAEAGDAAVLAWEMNIGNDNPGCDYHPSIATHRLMADALVAKLQAELGW